MIDNYGPPGRASRCPQCSLHWLAETPTLIEAFARLGIIYGEDSWGQAGGYFETYHRKGHRK